MKKSSIRYAAATAAAVLLAACSGGTQTLPTLGGAAPSGAAVRESASRVTEAIAVKPNVAVNPVNFSLSASSISPGSKSVTIVLTKVNGKKPPKGVKTSVSANLKKCTKGCTVAGPSSPAGTDLYTLTIYDQPAGKKGAHALATGAASGKIKASTKPQTIKVTLAKIPASLAFGTIPSATAGTAMSPTTLPLTVTDADGNAIAGTYSTTITVANSDTSSITQGSYLEISGGTASRSISLTSSSTVPQIGYGGLAMAAVTLTASATGLTPATASFAPTNPAIAYSGALVGGSPEIDLYNPTAGQAGNSSSFTLTQAGWTTFANNFTYATGGSNNNCTSYAITPASGTATVYTVTVGSSPSAGTCTLTATGGASSTLNVLLTYTTSGVGINLRHRKPR